MISRTGYTGERGYEIMVARDLAPWIWDTLLMVGRPLGIMPVGVAARESLRTEAGLLLNGNDMDAETNPIEAGVGWVVKLSKDFCGPRCNRANQRERCEAEDGGTRGAGTRHDSERVPDLWRRQGNRIRDERPAAALP
jgi:glycine cleavage system aminomethyltransferase T